VICLNYAFEDLKFLKGSLARDPCDFNIPKSKTELMAPFQFFG